MTSAQRFEELYGRCYGDVERYVRRRAPHDMVTDLVADVFLVAWRRLDEVPDAEARLWLYGVARNVLANHARGTIRARHLAERVAANTATALDDHADAVAARTSIAAAFDQLSDADQEILRLIAWEGLGIREAAAVLDCGVTTCAMRLNRARRRLHARMRADPPVRIPVVATTRKGQAL